MWAGEIRMEITEKTIWITGASSGIGLAIAQRLAAQNNFIIVSARSSEKLEALCSSQPDKFALLPMDVSDSKALSHVRELLCDITDYLDMLIMCAGTCEYDNGPSFDGDLYQRVFATNFFGAINTVQLALPLLKKSERRAEIVGVSSLSTLAPFSRAEAYGSSKAALEYFLSSLRVDLIDSNIDVTIVRPGFVDTPLTRRNDFDMPFIQTPEEAASAVIKGLVNNRRVINFPWKMVVTLKVLYTIPWIWFNVISKKLKKSKEL